MPAHECNSQCDCRRNLDKAAESLEVVTRLLAAVAFDDSIEVIEASYARVKIAQARLRGAVAAYRDHVAETSGDALSFSGTRRCA